VNKIEVIIQALEDVNAKDIEIYDMREKSPFFDFLVISSVTSNRGLKAAVEHLTDDLAKHQFSHPRVEGKHSNSWVLVDAKDIIVNIFTPEEREFYDIEKMLVEIKRITSSDLS